MNRVANILRTIANYVSGSISKEEFILGIQHELRKMEKEDA